LHTYLKSYSAISVSFGAEILESLYKEMEEFIRSNPDLDLYGLLSVALTDLLFLNRWERFLA